MPPPVSASLAARVCAAVAASTVIRDAVATAWPLSHGNCAAGSLKLLIADGSMGPQLPHADDENCCRALFCVVNLHPDQAITECVKFEVKGYLPSVHPGYVSSVSVQCDECNQWRCLFSAQVRQGLHHKASLTCIEITGQPCHTQIASVSEDEIDPYEKTIASFGASKRRFCNTTQQSV